MMLNYFFESSICLAIFYSFYFAFLRKDTFFHRNRYYLVATSILSLFIPLLDIPNLFPSENEFSQVLGSVQSSTLFLEEVSVGSTSNFLTNWDQFFWVIYGLVVSVGMYRVYKNHSKLIAFANTNQTIKSKGYQIVYTNGKLPTFSYFNYLFWDDTINLETAKARQIEQHELAHISGKHSYDLVFFEILKVIFWFNPIMYCYRNSLAIQHEFIADQAVISKEDKSLYSKVIIESLFQQMELDIVHNFNQSQIKTRIIMMKKIKTSNAQKVKLLLVTPLLLGLMIVFSCESDFNGVQNLERNNPTELNAESISSTQAKVVYAKTDEVFTVVEKPAEPLEGKMAFLMKIKENIVYPEKARKDGIEGKVFVKFIIEKDGSLTNVEVQQGLREDCDKAAIKAVKEIEMKWSPGTQRGNVVRQQITLPINFKIS